MASITSATGLVSGIDYEELVTKLMKIERQPITKLETKSKTLTAEQNAFNTVLSQLLSLKTTLTPLKSGVSFRTNTTSSSNESILTAKANSDAAVGSYNFTVLQTAQNNQLVSKGFTDADKSSIGSGTISLELGKGNLDKSTDLSLLRNQEGIRRGTISITDRSGATAKIDLSKALTLSDVLNTINSTTGISVKAKIDGDSIVIQDTSGATNSNLIIADVNNGNTASDLGIAGSVASSSLKGTKLVGITESTSLNILNDGNGIGTNGVASDMQITLRDGTSFGVDLNALNTNDSLDLLNNGQGIRGGSIKITNKAGASRTIDLSDAKTIQDVLDKINNAGLNLTASWVNGNQFSITDGSKGDKTFAIENVGGGSTATDLGLTSITSKNAKGNEVFRVNTIGDVKRVIEAAAAKATGNPNAVCVNIASDGKRLEFTDNTGGSGDLTIESVLDSTAAEDLGLAGTYTSSTVTGDRIISGLNTVLLKSLNGGKGVATGNIQIQTRDGNSATIDLTNAETLQDVLDAFNNSGLSLSATLNDAGTGIKITDTSGGSAANFTISDIDSTMAADLKITTNSASTTVDSGNNQLQYVSRATLLSDLKNGQGISAGSFTITSSKGTTGTITLSSTDVANMTVGNLIDKINALSIGVKASINQNGDGILLTDTAGGATTMTVTNTGSSTTATDLNLAGSASTAGAGTIDGSYEYKITVGGSDTLKDLVNKINKLGANVTASVINDGGSTNAYHLSLTSKISGKAGNIILNSGSLNLGMFDLVQGQDAIVSMGATGSSMIFSSSTNTFTGLVGGLTLTANGVSSSPVTITVSRDSESIVKKMNSFVESFNKILSSINELTSYEKTESDSDSDDEDDTTITTGLLFGNNTINTVESKLLNMLNKSLFKTGEIRSLSQLGFSYDSDNGQITFDEETFTKALQNNGTAVENFFSTKETGFAYDLSTIIDNLTDDTSGLVSKAIDTYDSKLSNIQKRIEYLEELATAKETRLYKQFTNLEKVLATLQNQQSALDSILDLSKDDDD
jgi:flagellar hook-associated protein 2